MPPALPQNQISCICSIALHLFLVARCHRPSGDAGCNSLGILAVWARVAGVWVNHEWVSVMEEQPPAASKCSLRDTTYLRIEMSGAYTTQVVRK